jgi:hypothetical protein
MMFDILGLDQANLVQEPKSKIKNFFAYFALNYLLPPLEVPRFTPEFSLSLQASRLL